MRRRESKRFGENLSVRQFPDGFRFPWCGRIAAAFAARGSPPFHSPRTGVRHMKRLRIGIALLLAAGAAFPVAAQQVPTHPNAPEPVQIPEPDESTDSPEAVLAQA